MELQKVLSLVRQAIDDYEMIDDGDRIAVGISGGKDSLCLLTVLAKLRLFYPKKFELYAITIDLGWDNLDLSKIKLLCDEINVPYYIVKTDIAKIVFEERKEENPCSLCAKMRKGALNNKLIELGINKVAYAHHKDDVVVTMLMSLMFEGRFHTFNPVTLLEKTNVTVIRPLIYMDEANIKGYINKYSLPVVKSPCPQDKHTKREYCVNILHELNRENPGVKNRMFSAIVNSNLDGWNKNKKQLN